MSELTESKQTDAGRSGLNEIPVKKIRAVFAPRTSGIFILLIIILGFIAGHVRKELALSLSAAVFLALWTYCLLMTLLLALTQRGRAGRLSLRIRQREISVGERAEIAFSEAGADGQPVSHNAWAKLRRSRLPGILIRCRLLLRTADERRISRDFDPDLTTAAARSLAVRRKRKIGPAEDRPESFAANERGAFLSDYDELAVFDILGLFRFAYRIPCEAGYRLLVCPRPADEPPSPTVNTGGTEHPSESQLRRSDNLIDHRPYIPGDDPRRINWKLYGHGNELFVREGEREPPPHSNVLILIDTHFDPMLFSPEAGRRGIDLLCENALACALELIGGGIDVRAGYTGMAVAAGVNAANGEVSQPQTQAVNAPVFLHGGTTAEIAAIFARPAAIRWSGGGASGGTEFPAPPADCGILVFALPRANADSSALSRFLERAASEDKRRFAELIFMYEGSGRGAELDEAAAVCEAYYRRRTGVRVRLIKAGD